MGQSNSRASPDARIRSRLRPVSWAPSSNLPTDHDHLNASERDPPPPSPLPQSSTTRPRPLSQSFSRFTNLLATHHEDSVAGPSESDTAGSSATRRHRLRMSRARNSLTSFTSIPTYLHRRLSSRSQDTDSAYASSPSLLAPSSNYAPQQNPSSDAEPESYLSHLQVPELDLGFDDNTLDRVSSNQSISRTPRRVSSVRRDGRASSMLSSLSRSDRGIRSLSSLRRRRSPARREEDQAVLLSRLLSAAAAATAVSLMGDDHRAVSEARSVTDDGEDGTFDSFLQALQNGRIASALRQNGNQEDGGEGPGGSPAPLNFFRMFRFGSSAGNRSSASRSGSRGDGGTASDNQDGEEENGRMIPIIIVGIRSINPNVGNAQDDNIPPFLDALSSFPTPLTSPGDHTVDGMLPQPQQRFSHRRRASMGGLNPFPSNTDAQRSYRAPERPRPWSTVADSPSGPLPPPSTPASSGLSAVSSGTNTPTFSTSPPSPTVQSSAPSRRGSFIRRATGSNLEPTAEEPESQRRLPRQRRNSESDFTPRFGSGSSRRNGVVEPDHNPGEGSRSWIIYVLGGSYPENHPILTTPSLFTDSPTYEDMMLLSSLLGPVKPPVASEEDVANAGGLFTIRAFAGQLVATAVDESDTLALEPNARCQVCLCDFEAEEEARRLIKCGHFFHRECIDQWLTTGRNSCPLCRGQGVNEKEAESSQSTTDVSDMANPNTVA
ncbi:hypothetical protein BU24DRAFT_418909 [Aaosphaeria arxii CBS 175.79]|uniref:RING-type domain-containing protein n=1 Tax=Aaosphaeria arxii CBS 175.79 TaxID=1450172 RepID=A0A6A5Y187_9PLEO|nr:uncharacterized protein BU24DRAFT_418909 [Aaosphaeria arxii CBS 175.79]KAF2019315.1 hypothetical protein BU24DRAFT_418909 [Aaosphaeria arxii CBS 175.79]